MRVRGIGPRCKFREAKLGRPHGASLDADGGSVNFSFFELPSWKGLELHLTEAEARELQRILGEGLDWIRSAAVKRRAEETRLDALTSAGADD